MSSSRLCQAKKEHLKKLHEDYVAVLGQMSRVLVDADAGRLERQAEKLEREISKWEEKVKQCEAGAVGSTFQQRYLVWEEHIPDINFKEAFEIAQCIIERLETSDGGAALFLLQNTHVMGGHWCVKRLKHQLKSMTVDFKPYPIGPTAASRMDAWTFLKRMGEHLKCAMPTRQIVGPDEGMIQDYTQSIHKKLKGALQMGSVVFIEVCTGVTLAYQNHFLTWFLEEFWRPLIQDLPNIRRAVPSVSVVCVITSQVPIRLEDPVPIPCCQLEDFDACQFLELPLRPWKEGEIRRWLFRFSGLTPQHVGHQNIADVIAQMANAIYLMGNNGQPHAVYSALVDRLRQFYNKR